MEKRKRKKKVLDIKQAVQKSKLHSFLEQKLHRKNRTESSGVKETLVRIILGERGGRGGCGDIPLS